MHSFPRAAVCVGLWLWSAASFADHSTYGNCPTEHYGATQGLSWYVTDGGTGALIGDGAELDVSQDSIGLTFHFVADAYGTCEIRGPNCANIVDTYERTVSHIRVAMDAVSTIYNGTYAVGRVYGKDPADGTTASYHVLDTSDTVHTTGPVSTMLYKHSPGTYTFRFENRINSTPCGMEPTMIGDAMTIRTRNGSDDENLGNCSANGDGSSGGGGDGEHCDKNAGNPINSKTGNKYQAEHDLAGPVLPLSRHYNSMLLLDFGLGRGWMTRYHKRLETISATLIRARRADGRAEPFTKAAGVWTAEADSASTLTEDATGFTLVTGGKTTERYDSAGRLLSETDRVGDTTTYSRDADTGRLTAVTDAFGRTLTFSYAGSRIGLVTHADGSTVAYGYDGGGNLVSTTYADGKSRLYHYENAGFPNHLTGITDETGTRYATYGYDSAGRGISTEHAGGAERHAFTYNSDGTTTVTDAMGQARTFAFSKVKGVYRIASVTGAPCDECRAAAFLYDANGNATRKTDFNGNVTTYVYDTSRNLETSRTEAYGTVQARTITTQWHPTLRRATRITEPGRVTDLSYDANGSLLQKAVTASGTTRTWTFTYDSHGRVLTEHGPRTDVSDVTTYAYDTSGNLVSVTNALGHVTRITQSDAHGRPLRIEDPNGLVTLMAYDARGRLANRTMGGELTTFEYNAAGDLVKVTAPDGSVLNYAYDTARRLTGMSDALGNRIAYTLDAAGHRVREDVHDPQNVLTATHSRVFDALGRLSQTLGAQSQTTQYGYDNNGNMTGVTDPLGHGTTRAYDALNRLAQVTDAAGGIATFSYDASDALTQVVDPRGLVTQYAYNGFGERTQVTSPDAGVTTNTYDARGLLSTKDARNLTTTFQYDALGRATRATHGDGTVTQYRYDEGSGARGRLTGITDASGATDWTFDLHGRVTSRRQTMGSLMLSVQYSYDAQGRLVQTTLPSGKRLAYSYDAAGRIVGIAVEGQTLVSGIVYEPFGPARSWTWGSGAGYSRSFDADRRLTGFPQGAAAQSITYDADSRITALTGDGAKTFAYDVLDRLTSATSGLTYTYDANGNRLSFSSNPYTYATTSNRLLSAKAPGGGKTRTFTYDAIGNVLGDGTRTFTYDARGRMVSAKNGRVPATSYTINALGQRVSKSLPGSTAFDRVFFYDDAGHLIGEYGALGTPIAETVYLGDQPIAVLTPSAVSYVHADQIMTPRAITNTAGTVIWRWSPDPFGIGPANEDPDGNGTKFIYNLRFPGQYYDAETGMHQNWHRDYDASIGRYLQSDPIGLDGGLNIYAYVNGNPLILSDPQGLWIPYNHYWMTHRASLDAGCSSLANELANEVRAVDDDARYPGTQAPRNSAWHHMADGTRDQTYVEAAGDYARYMAEMTANLCDKGMLARAIHDVQDSYSPAHKNFQQWHGFRWWDLPSLIVHGIRDAFPSPEAYQNSVGATKALLLQMKAQCPCACQ